MNGGRVGTAPNGSRVDEVYPSCHPPVTVSVYTNKRPLFYNTTTSTVTEPRSPSETVTTVCRTRRTVCLGRMKTTTPLSFYFLLLVLQVIRREPDSHVRRRENLDPSSKEGMVWNQSITRLTPNSDIRFSMHRQVMKTEGRNCPVFHF